MKAATKPERIRIQLAIYPSDPAYMLLQGYQNASDRRAVAMAALNLLSASVVAGIADAPSPNARAPVPTSQPSRRATGTTTEGGVSSKTSAMPVAIRNYARDQNAVLGGILDLRDL